MTMDALLFWYVAFLLGALALAAVLSEVRRKRFEPLRSEDHVFRCENCAFVYTDDADVDRSRCPQCGRTNAVYKF
jgi:hypothetical protein